MKAFVLGEITFGQFIIYLIRKVLFRFSLSSNLLKSLKLKAHSHKLINAVNNIGSNGSIQRTGRYLVVKTGNNIIKARRKSSDLFVINQIFVEEEYKKSIGDIKRQIRLSENPVIVDCGSNIGCASLYFKNHFPKSTIIALEPFTESFELLKINLSKKEDANYELFKGGLWSNSTSLKHDSSFRDGKEWSFKTIESPDGEIQSMTIQKIIEKYNLSEIDVLKIDIEGSEFEVFLNSESNCRALEKVKSIVMEIHDESGDRKKLLHVFSNLGFKSFELGELTLLLNQQFAI